MARVRFFSRLINFFEHKRDRIASRLSASSRKEGIASTICLALLLIGLPIATVMAAVQYGSAPGDSYVGNNTSYFIPPPVNSSSSASYLPPGNSSSNGPGVISAGGTNPDGTCSNQVTLFDTYHRSTVQLPPLQTARARSAAVQGADGNIYVLGGDDCGQATPGKPTVLDSVETWAPGSSQWTYATPLPTARTGLAAVLWNGYIFTMGGTVDGTPLGNTGVVEALDTITNVPGYGQWTSDSPLNVPRSGLAASVGPDGRIYAAGGIDATTGLPVPTMEIYNNSWSNGPNMPTPRAYFGWVTDATGGMLAMGGVTNITYSSNAQGYTHSYVTNYTNQVDSFDPNNVQWAATPAFALNNPNSVQRVAVGSPTRALNQSVGGAVWASAPDGNTFIAGGTGWPTPAGSTLIAALAQRSSVAGNLLVKAATSPVPTNLKTSEELIENPVPSHTLTYYFQGNNLPHEDGNLEMDLTPPSGPGTVLNLLANQGWLSSLPIHGQVGPNAAFTVSIPCGVLGVNLATTVTLSKTDLEDTSGSEQVIAQASPLLGLCLFGAQSITLTPSQPLPITLSGQELKVTVQTVLGLNLGGTAPTLQVTDVTGTP